MRWLDAELEEAAVRHEAEPDLIRVAGSAAGKTHWRRRAGQRPTMDEAAVREELHDDLVRSVMESTP